MGKDAHRLANVPTRPTVTLQNIAFTFLARCWADCGCMVQTSRHTWKPWQPAVPFPCTPSSPCQQSQMHLNTWQRSSRRSSRQPREFLKDGTHQPLTAAHSPSPPSGLCLPELLLFLGALLVPARWKQKHMTPNVGFVKAVVPFFPPSVWSLKRNPFARIYAPVSVRISDLTSGPAGPSSPRYPGCPVLPGSPWKTTRPPLMSSPLKHFPSLIKSLLAKPRLLSTICCAQLQFCTCYYYYLQQAK